MTSRERVGRAVHFQSPDRVPHYLPDGKENDIIWLWPSRLPDQQPWKIFPDGIERRIDAWGTLWERPAGSGLIGEKTRYAIPDIANQAEFIFPDINATALMEVARKAISENNASSNPRYCLGVMPFSSLNEGVHNLTGLDRMFIAYYEEPEKLKALIARLAAGQRESIKRLSEIGCDGVMGYDDWGLQDRPMISVDMVREFFEPHYRRNWEFAHSLGLDVWMHSCGHILELLPLFAEWGLNVIQEDQQENMGLENMDAVAGGKLCFWCPVDIQKTMIEGDEGQIRDYVKRMKRTIGNHNGGLVSMAYSQPESIHHAPEKTAAMCAAFREFEKYG